MKPKKKEKKRSGSLLSQLLGRGKKREERKKANEKKRKAGKKVSARTERDGSPSSTRSMTRLERSIAEIRQMTQIGQKDPERLARLLANMLAKEREKQQADKARFDALVWEIIHRNEGKKGSGEPPLESS